MAEDWIGVQEAADLLRVTRQMTHKLIASGDLPGQRLSPTGPWMLRRGDVVEWPAKRVEVLARKAAEDEGGQLRVLADIKAILGRMKPDEVVAVRTSIKSIADREGGVVADRLRGIYEWMETWMDDSI